LQRCLDNLPAIQSWLTEHVDLKKRLLWNHPTTIWRHFEAFRTRLDPKITADRRTNPKDEVIQKLTEELDGAQQTIADMRAREKQLEAALADARADQEWQAPGRHPPAPEGQRPAASEKPASQKPKGDDAVGDADRSVSRASRKGGRWPDQSDDADPRPTPDEQKEHDRVEELREWKTRAEKAEQERDDWRQRAEKAEQDLVAFHEMVRPKQTAKKARAGGALYAAALGDEPPKAEADAAARKAREALNPQGVDRHNDPGLRSILTVGEARLKKAVAREDSPKPKKSERGVEWSQPDYDYLVRIYMEDQLRSNATLAEMCTTKFGREITMNAITGAINRLRKRDLIPRYRPGHERKPK
jgi:hypothetical protein